jgi:transcriptional regulator with GAF, ATPase, and Fis domain
MNAVATVSDERIQQADRLAIELSSEFISLPAGEIVKVVGDALRRIGDELGADRSTLIEFSDKGTDFRAAYHWAADGLPALDSDAHALYLVELLDRLGMSDEPIVLEQISESPPAGITPAMVDYLRQAAVDSVVLIPILTAGQRACVLAVEAVRPARSVLQPLVTRLRLLGEILAGALARFRQAEALRQSRVDFERLTAARDDQESGSVGEHTHMVMRFDFDRIIGDSPALTAVLSRMKEVMPTDTTVLLLGETGTGKELIARALHQHGPRRSNPMVCVNCSALPPTLIESELFGHERGAFTGAVASRPGRFQLAHRGTLFLDEIGDLPLELQSKLLRVLEEGEFDRLGSSHTQKVDVRILAATNRDLAKAVAEGEFREDLYYRLNVFLIRLPPLRERREDIPALVWFIIRKRQHSMHRSIQKIPADVMEILQRHDWPGNVRELENVVERALLHSPGDTLRMLDEDLERPLNPSGVDARTLSAVERKHIEEVLRECRWRINGTGNAAERLGLHPNTLRFRMKKLGIVRQERRA